MRLTKNQKKEFGKALYNAGNLVFAIVILGQFFIDTTGINLSKMLFGFMLWVVFFIFATILNREE